jgi:hypothetical protein
MSFDLRVLGWPDSTVNARTIELIIELASDTYSRDRQELQHLNKFYRRLNMHYEAPYCSIYLWTVLKVQQASWQQR